MLEFRAQLGRASISERHSIQLQHMRRMTSSLSMAPATWQRPRLIPAIPRPMQIRTGAFSRSKVLLARQDRGDHKAPLDQRASKACRVLRDRKDYRVRQGWEVGDSMAYKSSLLMECLVYR